MLKAYRLDYSRIFFFKYFKVLICNVKFIFGKNFSTNQFKETSGSRFNVGSSIMRLGKWAVE